MALVWPRMVLCRLTGTFCSWPLPRHRADWPCGIPQLCSTAYLLLEVSCFFEGHCWFDLLQMLPPHTHKLLSPVHADLDAI